MLPCNIQRVAHQLAQSARYLTAAYVHSKKVVSALSNPESRYISHDRPRFQSTRPSSSQDSKHSAEGAAAFSLPTEGPYIPLIFAATAFAGAFLWSTRSSPPARSEQNVLMQPKESQQHTPVTTPMQQIPPVVPPKEAESFVTPPPASPTRLPPPVDPPAPAVSPKEEETSSGDTETGGEEEGEAIDLAGEWKEGLPEYDSAEVAKHVSAETRVWVSYRHGVYDITDFMGLHPGGVHRMKLAVGRSIEPFWRMYQQHAQPEIHAMLEEYRIGNLKDADEACVKEGSCALAPDGYENEPSRHPGLHVLSVRPFNAETPAALLVDAFVTPSELHFKRNHLPVPSVDPSDFSLEITGVGVKGEGKAVSMSLEELKKFPKVEKAVTIQCAGNRRSNFHKYRPVKGLDWNEGGIGTAVWGGCLLRDVLEAAGLDIRTAEDFDIRHLWFEGLDQDELTETNYAASIPISKVLTVGSDVLLAWEMNGEPLPRDHGYPLRVVVPGIVGARSVKWVKRIVAARQESPSFWQQTDYKVLPPAAVAAALAPPSAAGSFPEIDWKAAPAIQETPVQSGICAPDFGQVLEESDKSVSIKGYAYSGGGRAIIRVEVSLDGGASWQLADLLCGPDEPCPPITFDHDLLPRSQEGAAVGATADADPSAEEAVSGGTATPSSSTASSPSPSPSTASSAASQAHIAEGYDFTVRKTDRQWAWVLWEADLDIPPEMKGKKLEICARAVDAAYNVQPERADCLWNPRGCLCTEYPRVTVYHGEAAKEAEGTQEGGK